MSPGGEAIRQWALYKLHGGRYTYEVSMYNFEKIFWTKICKHTDGEPNVIKTEKLFYADYFCEHKGHLAAKIKASIQILHAMEFSEETDIKALLQDLNSIENIEYSERIPINKSY